MILNANALQIPLADKSINCCVTSPPYYGLRDYGTAKWIGGNPDCDHKVGRFTTKHSEKQGSNMGSGEMQARNICPHCGAHRVDEQLGLEQSPDDYVANMVQVFREVWRVLRDDGTCWLNLGDTYNSGGGTVGGGINNSASNNTGRIKNHRETITDGNLKPKDLIGIPWRVAFALQADGWYLRSDIIWHKPNPMPESVKDRPTKSHEYIFLLTKSAKYYYAAEAIREKANYDGRHDEIMKGSQKYSADIVPGGKVQSVALGRHERLKKDDNGLRVRNKRSVWKVATVSYKGSHFATFPPKLIEPCILAGCPECGIVLDPFFGSGTTGQVAIKHNRRFVGLELNPEYIKLAKKRTSNVEVMLL